MVFVLFVFVVSLNGCVTTRKQKDLEIQGLRNQVSVLNTQIQTQNEEILRLQEALAAKGTVSKGKKIVGEVKSRPNSKQIQTALKSAGYYQGAIDGKIGKMTRQAIRAFQRDNNLLVDGKVGKRTWALLQKYLYKKTK